MSDKLSNKHTLFADNYLRLMNGTRAYMLAYPSASYETAMVNSSKLLRNTKVKEYIEGALRDSRMSADVALRLMEDIAAGDVAELMEITSVSGGIDLKTAKERGLTKLIKKIRQKTTTKIGKKDDDEDVEIHDLEIELYPADSAIRDILKIHGKFVEKHAVTDPEGNAIDPKESDARFERAISTLADALREVIPAKGSRAYGKLDTPK